MSDTETLDRPATGKKSTAKPAFAIERDSFLAAIRAVGQVVEARNTIPILSNLLIRVTGGAMTIIGTDLDMLVEVNLDCASAGPAGTTAASDRLIGAVETLRPGLVEAELDDGVLILKQGSSRRRLPTLPADDFPEIKVGSIAARFEIEAGRLLAMLDATASSISTEETRYYLNGVFFHVPDGKTLTAASTDGHRLARATIPVPSGAEKMPGVIVARKSVRELRRLLGAVDTAHLVPLEISETKMTAKIGSTRLVAKLIDGTYPDYSRTIPSANDRRLVVHSTEFLRCIRAAAAVCTERTRGVRLEMAEAGSQAVGQSTEGGKAVEPIDAEFGPGELVVGVNSRYALDIGAIFGEAATLKLAFADPLAPILITSDDKPAITAVLMPMRA